MGGFISKDRYAHQSASPESETPPSKSANRPVSPQDFIYWEEIYKERFARKFIFSLRTEEPLFISCERPAPKPEQWRRLSTDSMSRYNPRYREETPEPLSTDLAERTRHELRDMYHEYLLFGGLRLWMKEAWMLEWRYVPRVPYLTDEVIFPPASEVKNGHLLPARIRSYISGENEEVAPAQDAFSTQRYRTLSSWLRLDDPSQMPAEDMLMDMYAWLNQTTAVYFEPEYEKHGGSGLCLPFVGRGICAAWHQVVKERGEEPNLQQDRYFAHPLILLGEPRPIADLIVTHRRICGALADAQDKPISSKDPYSWVEHGAEMGVVYPSLIIIVDQTQPYWRSKSEADTRDIMFKQFSVLLVRTGNEEHLSEPIEFSELDDVKLPLGRDELLQENQQVVRVRLDTAVRFIMELERREQDRCPRLKAMRKILDEETSRDADKFAADSLAIAEEHGSIDLNSDTREAVRRARAYLDGDALFVDPAWAESDAQRDYCYIRSWM